MARHGFQGIMPGCIHHEDAKTKTATVPEPALLGFFLLVFFLLVASEDVRFL
jgi:hypothetical protein